MRQLTLISKFMTSSIGTQITEIHELSNIWKIKGNMTMKFGQLIEQNMRNIFLVQSYTKCVLETNSRSFFKRSKLSTSQDQQSEIWSSLLLLYVWVENYQNKLTLRWWPLAFNSYKAFLKIKRGLELVFLSHSLHDFWRNIFFTSYLI